MSRCASCGAPIAVPGWANTKPLDADCRPHACVLEWPAVHVRVPEPKPVVPEYELRDGRWLKKT